MYSQTLKIQLKEYLKAAEKSQEQLAFEIGLDPSTLSKKLASKNKVLTKREKKEIVVKLVEWQAITSLEQAEELLSTMGETPALFLSNEWDSLRATATVNQAEKEIEHISKPLEPELRYKDWQTAQFVPVFYGRNAELADLEKKITHDQTKLITILGLGGTGKTTLAVKLVERVEAHFEFIKWCSLKDTPSLEEFLEACLSFLGQKETIELPKGTEAKVNLLVHYLANQRCLLVLDNFEAVMASGTQAGKYLPGYENYGKFLIRLCQSIHQSCIILTSREKPDELTAFEVASNIVYSFKLGGLDENASIKLLQTAQLTGSPAAFLSLTKLYGGSPLQLKLAASYIQSLFGNRIEEFLEFDTPLTTDISEILNQHFARLSSTEKAVIYWLAVLREPTSVIELLVKLDPVVERRQLLAAINSLQRRSLLENSADPTRFNLQPVVLEFVTKRLVNRIANEIITTKPKRLVNHALLIAEANDYLRETQLRLLLDPLLKKLAASGQGESAIINLLTILATWPLKEQRYGSGNLINLLIRLRGNLNNLNLSNLNIQQVYLRGVALENTDFSGSAFNNVKFSSVFGSVLSIAFSPKGEYLAISDVNGLIRLWNLNQDKPHLTLSGHRDRVRSIVFSPDGNLLVSGGDDNQVLVWRVSNGQKVKSFAGHTGRVWTVAFSPDGKRLATAGSERVIKIWQFATGQLETELAAHPTTVLAVAFSSDGQRLASGGQDGKLVSWDTGGWQKVSEFLAHGEEVSSVVFSPDNTYLVSAGGDCTVKIWHAKSGAYLKTLAEYDNRIWGLAFSKAGQKLAVGVWRSGVILWNSDKFVVERVLPVEQAWQMAFSPEGKMMATGYENQMVQLWDTDSGLCLKTLHSYLNRVGALAFSPAGDYLISGSEDCLVRVWDYKTKVCTRVLEGHRGRVWALAVSPDGKFVVSGSQDQTVRVWNTANWSCNFTINSGLQIWSLSISPDNKLIAVGGNSNLLHIWDAASGQEVVPISSGSEHIRAVVFHPTNNDLVLTGSHDGYIRLWEISSGRCRWQSQAHQGWVRSVAFSPDGSLIASAGEDYTVKLWADEQCTQILSGHQNRVWTVSFSPDGKLVASGGQDQTVRVWNVKSGECIRVMQGHTALVRVVTFSPSGGLIASGSEDESVRLWNVAAGKEDWIELRSPRLYEGMRIGDSEGLSEQVKADLRILGAID